MKEQQGKSVELQIERLGIYGEGVARHEGFTLFVEGALPGERVEALIYEVRKSFGRARLTKVLTPSLHRVEPPCPYFSRCGGCQIMHLRYPEQLIEKRQRVVDALERIAKIDFPEVFPCMPSPLSLGYRNKIQLPVCYTDGQPQMGFYMASSHELVAIDGCLIHGELGESALQQIRQLLREMPLADLRHLLIKSALHTQQILLVIVTRSGTSASLAAFAREAMKRIPQLKGVVHNCNPDRMSNTILGPSFGTLAGEGEIEEQILGLRFTISPASFFQVNPLQAERLYQTALAFAALTGKERVLDAYCGVGTLSLLLARQAKEVIGIESVAAAISDAKKNALLNQISHATFLCAPAEEAIDKLEKIDVALLNPPRKGCDPRLLQSVMALGVKRIVYVSCDLATLARDLSLLTQGGYRVAQVQPYDMFPQTAHVETVVQLLHASNTTDSSL